MTGTPDIAPVLPPADLPVDLRRVELLCAWLRPEEGVELERISWAIGKRPRGEGWDNVLWPIGTLDGAPLVLRIARRRSSRALLGREVTVLRRLRGLGTTLPMDLPRVIATAEDAVAVEWIDGVTAAEADAVTQEQVAEDLARMLATIHSGPAPEVVRNPVRGVPLVNRAEFFAADLDRAGLDEDAARRVAEIWRAGIDAEEWQGRELLLHGDPHPGNVVVPSPTSPGAVTLIDWGDTTRGDPASDLGALLLHSSRSTTGLLEVYRASAAWTGIEDDAIWEALRTRARAWAVRMALALVLVYPEGHSLGRIGRRLLAS